MRTLAVSRQSKTASMVEALTNTAVGFLISLLLQTLIVPYVTGYRTTFAADFTVVMLFTIASVVRGYGLRRVFNRV